METFSPSDCIHFGWNTFKKRPWFLIGAFLTTVVASYIVSTAVDQFTGQQVGTLMWGLGVVVSMLAQTLIGMGMVALLLKASSDVASARIADLWHPQSFLQYLVTSIVYGLGTLIGIILFVVPGIIFILVYQFANYIVVDRGMSPMAALKESARITRGHRWELLVLLGLVVVFNILGAIVLLVGLLVSIPVTSLALVHAYRTLSREASSA
jgi:uncharacterized membrane protein